MEILEAYKFCPVCGNKFENKKTYLKCPNCEHAYYLNPKPTTVVILYNDKDEFMLVERAVDPNKGMLDTPGGFVDDNETFEESARRELKEELDIEVGELTYIGSSTGKYLFKGINYSVLNVLLLAKIDNNAKITPADDVASYKFYPMDSLPTDKFAFEPMKAEFEMARKYLGK